MQANPGTWAGSGWAVFDGSLSSIAAVRNASDRLEIFGLKASGAVVHRVQTSPGIWAGSGWAVFDGFLSRIAAAVTNDGRVDLFGVNPSGGVVHRVQTSPGDWVGSDWVVLDGKLSTLAAATNGEQIIELFGTTENGQVLRRTQTRAGASTWTPWVQLDTTNYNIRQLAVQNVLGTLTLFGVNIRGDVFYRNQNILDRNSWSAWTQLSAFDTQLVLPTPVHGFKGAPTLTATGLPAGMTAAFAPPTVTASQPTSTLVVTTATSVKGGDHTLTIGTDSTLGANGRTATFTVTVPALFDLLVSPQEGSVAQGSSLSVDVNIHPLNSFTQTIPLSFKPNPVPMPPGITVTFTPPGVKVTASHAKMIVTASEQTPEGMHNITVSAGGKARNFQLTVTVGTFVS